MSPAPASLDELLARSGQTALELSGADQTAWNGNIIETKGSILGLAHWDGTLYLDGECILEPLHDMYDRAGERHSRQTLASYRESLATVLHEHAHFLGPFDSSQEAAREAFVKPGSRQLEEGVVEAWAQDHLDDYITRLGIDKVAPGINSVEAGGYYAAFVPAVRTIAADLESRNNLGAGHVLRDLNRQSADGQFPLLVGLVYNSTRLPELEPGGTIARDRLESILRSGLAHLDQYELHPPGFAAAKSRSTATDLLAQLSHEIQSAESAYTFHPSACALPPPTPVQTALAGIAPPTAERAPSSPARGTPGLQTRIARGRQPTATRICG